jgi:hypothetical protein
MSETEAEFWHRKSTEHLKMAADNLLALNESRAENAKLRWCLECAVAHDFDRKQYAGYADYHALMIDDLMNRYDEMLEDAESGEEDEDT